ncbi:MAG: hypothetical protein WBF42_00720 [Terracidiphilus sp.]
MYAENPGSVGFKPIQDLPHVSQSSTAARNALQSGPANHLSGETMTSMDHYAETRGIYEVGDLADAGENDSQPKALSVVQV